MEHNMWHYLYLFVHINKKDYTEYNGMELYLAMRMAKNDVSFFPNYRAMALEKFQGHWGDRSAGSDSINGARTKTPDEVEQLKPLKTSQEVKLPSPNLKQLNEEFDSQIAIREKQKEMEDVQRQLLTTQQQVLALIANLALGDLNPSAPPQKSQHFFVD
ncbi:Aste57867_2575 [Aphanomyces stellatus]|uniref:Aste57867_2575 protein n=1 Tax=Aphanomyces stellatus TaxID=120398 RepID=A0A485KDJ1_9STRA|nr:hypothetical protein As57867_002568 [Aphanomyces stellatus]VFT79771.1 Aste57867_2575 [Aphanomyces stellatus]